MTPTALWATVLVACAVTFLWKLLGHSLPPTWFSHPKVAPVVGLVTASLLAGLVVVQTLSANTPDGGPTITLDARAAAVAVAAVLFWRKVPFVVVVVAAAAVAAALRLLGWG
jgi:branched-subunit amino acid transport protein